MGYLYENSNPERFQHLCQSLLAQTFPKLQCFPIGQPDGGRDGWDHDTKTVLQVKFRRTDESESAEWMIKALEHELPKILRLAKRGASEYIIATNASGTAHLDSGRIDKVQNWMDKNLPIPGTCFWRDEIDRRLDNSSTALKLKHSELLSLEEGLDVFLGSALGTNSERQQDAIQAFIATQFESDRTVKFKQVNLSNDLLSLFVDIPVGFSRKLLDRGGATWSTPSKKLREVLSAASGGERPIFVNRAGEEDHPIMVDRGSGSLRRINLGTAELLLSGAAQDHLKRVVLEGAPGQGKSTLAQYVCQIHRARYLKRQEVLKDVPDRYKQTAFRVPFKVDLRDYAAFLSGNSPFETSAAPSTPRELEVFLAQLVAHQSGGIEFGAHDMVSLLKKAPALLFLDGLDEVADLSARARLVSSIGDALTRLAELDADLQVVVTSRPSVFGRAPSFDKDKFVTLNLQNIDSAHINEYAEKWLLARGLDDSEKHDVKKILAEKLELAHIKQLTRNPMQLTILLSLIHQVGHSLPDQRTDLYSRYVDTFLTREADKSARVREHRPVLLGFIQYLAWKLQTQVETSKSAGSVSAPDLQKMARAYLRDGGHVIEIADDLFGGGLERIFVLVERIEGLYEFEVQPLREFFCAQYLYSTAPVGTYRTEEIHGDRAQRFEALASNPLWLNVCRFYAGSCERGENGTLVYSLREMIKAGEIAIASHARRVGLALLQDWVFSNSKFAQRELVQTIFDSSGVRTLVLADGRNINDLVLAAECGQEDLRELLFNRLTDRHADGQMGSYCLLLLANGGRLLGPLFSEVVKRSKGENRTRLIVRMLRSGACADLPAKSVWDLIVGDAPSQDVVLFRSAELVRAEPLIAEQIPELAELFVDGVLNGRVSDINGHDSALAIFADLLTQAGSGYIGLMRISGTRIFEEDRLDIEGNRAIPSTVRDFLSEAAQLRDLEADDTLMQRDSPALWSSIVEIARRHFGDSWVTMAMAISNAGIRAKVKLPSGSDHLFDSTVPLSARARAARLRRGGASWWIEQLNQASTGLDRMFWAGLVLKWSSVENLYALSERLNSIVDSLDIDHYGALREALHAAADRELRTDRRKLSPIDLRPFSKRASVLVAIAFGAPSSELLYLKKQVESGPLRDYVQERHVFENVGEPPPWSDADGVLDWARRVNRLPNSYEFLFSIRRRFHSSRLPIGIATRILDDPSSYPGDLVSRSLIEVQRNYRPRTLASVSSDEDWTFD